MRRIIKRLSLAAILSLGCYYLTLWWYNSTGGSSTRDPNQKPVAFIAHTKDETLRRPVTRVIWQLINDGEPVFPGEAIRTSSEGEARIQFAESKRFIDLEPDSLIVISKSSDNEISLDLMDGGLQVNQGQNGTAAGETGPALTLKSGNSKVDLSKATASLSKSGNGKLDLQVLNGQVGGAEGFNRIDKDGIKILQPAPGRTFYFNPHDPQPVVFTWKGFPAGSHVTLEDGTHRKNLKPIGESETDSVSVKMAPGKHFWKLTAKDPKTQKVIGESAVFRLEVAARTPPDLLSPDVNTPIPQARAQSLELRWNRPASTQKIQLEIASDDSFSKKILSKDFTAEDSTRHSFTEGDYSVRLSARLENSDQVLVGPIRHLHITEKSTEPIVITWTKPAPETPLYYFDQAAVNMGWNSDQKDQVKSWRIKVAPNEDDLDDPKSFKFETAKTEDRVVLPKGGHYVAIIEALNDRHHVLAASAPKKFSIEMEPLLAAPRFQGEAVLDADPSGRLNLQWNEIPGAREYQVTLYDPNGKELHTGRFKKNSTALQNLLPGEFQVGVVAVDGHGRAGQKEALRKVRVPASSGLGVPKVKRIKVN